MQIGRIIAKGKKDQISAYFFFYSIGCTKFGRKEVHALKKMGAESDEE